MGGPLSQTLVSREINAVRQCPEGIHRTARPDREISAVFPAIPRGLEDVHGSGLATLAERNKSQRKRPGSEGGQGQLCSMPGSRCIEDVSPECRYGFPRRLISRFQRQGDVNLGGEEHRHVAQSGADLDRLNERLGKGAADVRDQGQRSVRG